MTSPETSVPSNFIKEIIDTDLAAGKNDSRVHTRFPPEPNGYLHIGHAKSICLNFGLAREYRGLCNLRFDDTNPSKEDIEYVDSIQEDVRWLGFDWENRMFYASDYFEALYGYAEELIQKGLAYVCDLTPEEVRASRGTLTEPGKPSPYRDRLMEENLDLFRRMRAGEFPDGSRTLRAKIDMASPNINMRDPVIYRILRATHHRTGDAWCIYPMYDYAHPISDAQEKITHSICTLEFEDHRPLYDWVLANTSVPCKPRQIEFARLDMTYTMMSKRKLLQLVNEGHVRGWDDPRMPTLAGIRRRGYPPEAIRDFCERIGVAKATSTVDFALLEHCVRENLNHNAPRAMAVLKPLKVILTNFPEDQTEWFEAENNPEDPAAGTRSIPFTRELFIEQDDFMEAPPKGFFRLAPGREVRLKHAYIVRCEEILKDPETGQVTELHCSVDMATRGGNAPDGRPVKGTLHWVSAAHARRAEVRLYDKLFLTENPYGEVEGTDFHTNLNPASLEILTDCLVEPSLAEAAPGMRFQFLRNGYFCMDPESTPDRPVFNRTANLKDSWAKTQKAPAGR